MAFIKKQAAARAMAVGPPNLTANVQTMDPTKRTDPDQIMREGTGDADAVKKELLGSEITGAPQSSFSNSQSNPDPHLAELQRVGAAAAHGSAENVSSYPIRQPWEYIEEVVQILKTASPLLILSMETIVDQINQRFKATPEEEVYRLICMLLHDAVQVRSVAPDAPNLLNVFSAPELCHADKHSR
jgi:transformation/transcription domain-associated protein